MMVNYRKRELYLKIFATVTFILTLGLLGMVAFWLLYPYPTIEQSPKPFEITSSRKVEQGGLITYAFNYTKHSSLSATVERQFVDGIVFASSSQATISGGKSSGRAVVEVPIPYTLPPGRYYLKVTARYQVNPIRTIEVVNYTEKFTVQEISKESEKFQQYISPTYNNY